MLKTAFTQWIRLALGSFLILLTLFGQAAWAALNVRYQDNIQGGATLFGNSFYLQTNDWDGAYPILRADVDGDPSTSISSSSDLVLPPGATVVKAFLSVETMYGIVVGSADFDSVKFKTPGGSYTTLNTASTGYLTRNIFNDAPGTGSDRYYRQMVFDVTSLLPTTPTGTYTVADPSPRNDNTADAYNQMGGWALTVVYRNPSATAQFRNITVADNWNFFNTAGEFVNVDIPNVIVPSSGTVNAVVGMTGTYGDPLLTDYVRVGNAAGALTVLTDPTTGRNNDALDGSIGWAANNNVSADGGPIISGNYTARNPNTGFSTNYSAYYATTVTSAMYDADIFNATGAIPANATPITVRVQQNSDGGDWLISGTYFVSVDVPAATLTKTMSPATVSAGTKTTYTFTIANTAPGNVNLTGLGFTDSLPSALIVASPNGVTLNNCTGASVTAVPGTGSISVGGLSLAAGQSCSVSVDAINKDGFSNEDCASNPAAFTNGSSNINTTSGLLRVGVTAQCLLVTPVDRSDAPAGYGAPTHTIVAGTRLGATVTTENAAYNSANADGDVDDGITLPTLTQNQTSTITATVAGAGGYLQGWIDWNGDGDFVDASEQIATNLQDGGALDTNTTAGTIAFDVNVPAGAVTTQTYARFRWSSTQNLDSTAAASDGEVEDYALTISPAPTVAQVCSAGTQLAADDFGTGGPKTSAEVLGHGYVTTDPADGYYTVNNPRNLTAGFFGAGSLDDRTPGDADGSALVINMLNAPVTFYRKTVTGITPNSFISFQAWINGTCFGCQDQGELQFIIEDLSGNTLYTSTDTYAVPNDMQWHQRNFVFNSGSNTSFNIVLKNAAASGASGNDILIDDIALCQVPQDYGDAPANLSSVDASMSTPYGSASHALTGILHLGATVDGEASDQGTGLSADGDGTDDDGVSFPQLSGQPILRVDQANGISVTTSAAGFLNAWVDWNQDGDWNDAGEQIATNQAVSAGANNLSVTPATTAPHGTTYARFRLSSAPPASPSPLGVAADGEVEDYRVSLVLPKPVGTCTAGIQNSGFENPAVAAGTWVGHPEDQILGWATTPIDPASGSSFAERNAIELWGTGHEGVPSHSGVNHAELNAYVPGALYQDMETDPGTILTWSFAHRGRSGEDTMRLMLGAPNATISQGTFTTGNTGWVVYSGTYTVPAGQYVTRFSFESVSAAGGSPSYGNFLDTIYFGAECSDYSDAPAGYGIPSHFITAGLQLGATAPDVETTAQHSATANGDDSNGTDDEDGVANFPDLSTASQTYTLNVVANNTSGSNARLVGWIDFNRDGAFGTDEAATTNVANGSSNQAIGLKWKTLPALQAGDTYLRLRLTTDTSIATGTASTSQSDGAANDGEVEDYMLTIANGGFTIRGTLFHDNNVDSVKNGAEKGIKDVVMVLYDTANGTCRSTKTGADGSYQFSAVQPAAANNYVVYEAAGEKIQTPTACPPAANDPSGFLSTTANSQTLTVTNADVSGVDFGDVQQPLFELDNQKTILPGTTVAYPHTFRTPADGVVDFSLATAADPSQLAWGTQLYLDNNCDAKLGSGDTVVDSPLALLAGDKFCLLVKVLAPTNASAGATHTVEVSSTFTFGDGSSGLADVVQTHSDITTTLSGTSPEPVGGEGKLSLTKSVWNVTRNIDGAVALPGETLRYTIAYENIGNGNVVELVINDTVPEFTQLVPGSLLCTNRPAGLPACAANSSADGSLDWTWAAGDKLAPGAHGSVSYEVVVE